MHLQCLGRFDEPVSNSRLVLYVILSFHIFNPCFMPTISKALGSVPSTFITHCLDENPVFKLYCWEWHGKEFKIFKFVTSTSVLELNFPGISKAFKENTLLLWSGKCIQMICNFQVLFTVGIRSLKRLKRLSVPNILMADAWNKAT